MTKLFRWNPEKDLILVVISLLWMWFAYYGNSYIYGHIVLLQLLIWVIITVIFVNVCFPAWWTVKKKKEGFGALGITKDKLLLSIILSIGLAIWRAIDLVKYSGNNGILTTIIFNGISIWEVFFLFSWLFSRFEHSFGKVPAIALTTFSVGLYHLGTLPFENILYLCFCICILSICFSITKNIFTLWPIYWTVGCSASTLKSGMSFSWLFIAVFIFVFLIQVGYLLYLRKSSTV